MTQKNPLENLQNAGDYAGIEKRIKEVDVSLPAEDDIRITGRFFYLDFKNREPNQEIFVDYIFRKIDRYCIPRKVLSKAKRSTPKLKMRVYSPIYMIKQLSFLFFQIASEVLTLVSLRS